MEEKTFYIKGMHCPSCEVFIEHTVQGLEGVRKAEVSLKNSRIIIQTENSQLMPTAHRLNHIFHKHGYSFSQKNTEKPQGLPIKTILPVVATFLLIVFLIYALGGSNILANISIDSGSNLPAIFLFGIAAGLSSCAALVGGLLLSVKDSWYESDRSGKRTRFLPFILFNGSRITTFAVLGGILGLLGGVLKISLTSAAILTLGISLVMLVIGFQMIGIPWFGKITFPSAGRLATSIMSENRIKRRLLPITIGALTFFIPCGYTIITQTLALESGNFWRGSSILTAFAVGTMPVLLLISYSSVKFYQNARFSNTFRFLSGLLVIFFALTTINSQLGVLGLPNIRTLSTSARTGQLPTTKANIVSGNSNTEIQVIQMEARGFEYFPKTIQIKAGLNTRFEITDNGSVGCARAVYARGLYPDVIKIQPGLNVVEFKAPAPGTYLISCSMWMVDPVTVIVK